MTNTTQKIGAGILATAIVSAIALTSATHASTTPSIDETQEPVEFTTAIDEKNFTFEKETLVEVNAEDIAGFDKELANISDEDLKKLDQELAAEETKENELRNKINKVISEDDWNTLSMKDIDDKLTTAGIEKIGDEKDPYYNTPVANMIKEFENITDAEWATLDEELKKATANDDTEQ